MDRKGLYIIIPLISLALVFLIFKQKAPKIIPAKKEVADPFIFKFDSTKADKCMGEKFVYDEFTLNSIPDSSLMLNQHLELTPNLHFSKDSFPIFNYEGKSYDFHPGVYTERVLSNIYDYKTTGNELYLKRVLKYYDVLIKNGVQIDSALLFPNNYSFKLHGYKNQQMVPPWFSGFTQGVALSAATRLYKITKDKKYLDDMRRIANSFYFLKPASSDHKNVWISCIDSTQNIWFEEYPQEYPGYTLNGKVFAILGLYEYYLVSSNPEIKKLVLGGLTTIKKNIGRYRMEGTISKYCLKHVANFDTIYHTIHVKQLHTLALITGDTLFEHMSRKFREDIMRK